MATEPSPTVVRWFTNARRRVGIVLGRLPNGEKLPGGPYSLASFVGFAVTLGLGELTKGVWGRSGGLGDLILLGAVSLGVGWAAGRVPTEKLNGWGLLHGARHTTTLARAGRHRGEPVKLPRAHRVRGRVAVDLADLPAPGETPAPQAVLAEELEQHRNTGRRRATPVQAAWAATGKEW